MYTFGSTNFSGGGDDLGSHPTSTLACGQGSLHSLVFASLCEMAKRGYIHSHAFMRRWYGTD